MNEADVKGGMGKNPFGGHARLDRLDLMTFIEPGASSEKVIYLATIQDAAHNYLFFGLGRNGTSAEEFAAASQYFFNIRSTNPSSWEHCRYVKNVSVQQGKRKVRLFELTDSQLQNMCFDRHYEHSGMNRLMTMERFLTWIKEERCKLLTNNWDQVIAYIDTIREREARTVPAGSQLPLRVWAADDQAVLIAPESPRQVAELLYYSPQVKQPRQMPVPKAPKAPKYQHLLELGVFNNESVLNNSFGGVPCPAD